MITSLRLVNFKNFADETLRVGPFTVIVGANASGKSNIRDALRFLHGIGRGYTLSEIIGGKYGAGGFVEWTGIRGAMDEVIRLGNSEFAITVEAEVGGSSLTYSVEAEYDDFRTGGFKVTHEELKDGDETVYEGRGLLDTIWVKSAELDGDDGPGEPLRSEQPALLQETTPFGEELTINVEPVRKMRSTLASIRFLDPVADRMREPSFPGQTLLGDWGQNLPTALESICVDPDRKRSLMSWVQELTPMDIEEIEFPRDPSGRVHLRIVEKSGRSVSAYSVSDGTLRFLAMAAALLGADSAGIYFFEEVDSGIHPNRLWLLVELFERQTRENDVQVITTTHAPDLLNFISDETFENTSVTYRDEEWEDGIIRGLAELPNAYKLRIPHGLGRLHSSGWMETSLAFTEGYSEEGNHED